MALWYKIIFWIAAVVGVVGLVLHILFFDAWRVPKDDPLLAASIEPNLSAGDLVIVARRPWVGRGELLRCADPEAPGRFVIARAIGKPADHIDIVDEVVSIDRSRTPSPRACDSAIVTMTDPRNDEEISLNCSIEDFGDRPFGVLTDRRHPEQLTKATVGESRWFLVSDNRHVHLDSRDYGQIDVSTCQHIVFRVVGAAGFGDTQRRFSIIW